MAEDRKQTESPPLAYSLRLFFERPLGLRWVPDNHLAVVYRMEMYHGLRGPGFFRINPFKETVKYEVNLNPDFISTEIASLQTQDAVQLGLRIALAYEFDPRPLPRDKALVFVKWPRRIHRAIVIHSATTALQGILPKFRADRVCRGQVFEEIRQQLLDDLTERLKSLGLGPILAMVLEVIVPPALQNTFTAVANRAAYTHDLSQYTPYELSEVRRRELYEVIRALPGGIRYLSVPGSEIAPSSWQVSKPPTQQIIPGQATPLLPNEPDVDIGQAPQRPGKSPRSHLWPPAADDLDEEEDD